MNISLTPELEKYVQDKVTSGLYTSASEVVRESLRLMHTADDFQLQRLEQLNQAIDIGMSQLQSGKKISPLASYNRLKNKIEEIAKDSE
jgi:antitoxin ParD1/3/4